MDECPFGATDKATYQPTHIGLLKAEIGIGEMGRFGVREGPPTKQGQPQIQQKVPRWRVCVVGFAINAVCWVGGWVGARKQGEHKRTRGEAQTVFASRTATHIVGQELRHYQDEHRTMTHRYSTLSPMCLTPACVRVCEAQRRNEGGHRQGHPEPRGCT